MLIPKQLIGGEVKPKQKTPDAPSGSFFDAIQKLDEISKKAASAPIKHKVETAYGSFDVEHKGLWNKRARDKYISMIEDEGRKEGWRREDGTVADTKAPDFSKTTPKQYEQTKKAVNARPQPAKPEPKPRINSLAQSRIDAFDQSRIDASPEKEYTGGDARLSRTAQSGRGMNATQQRRLTPQDQAVDVSAETKKNLQKFEDDLLNKIDFLGVRGAAKNVIANVAKGNEGAYTYDPVLGMITGAASDAMTPLASFESAVGNMYDPTATGEERLGAIGNAGMYALGAAGNLTAARGAVGNLKAFRQGRQVAKAAKVAGATEPASGTVTPPSPKPVDTPSSFSDAIGAPRAAGKGADDVSGIVPGFRQPIAKMPENRIESLSPQGRAIETWAGANLQKLIDNGVGEDLRTWDAVGKHYGSGAVPRNPEEFKYWVNDLVRTVDESDRNLSLSTEFATRDYAREMQDLRKLVSRSTPIPVNADPVKTIVGLQRQGNGWRVVPNPQLIPLSNVPEPFRLSVLENMRDGEMRYTTRANYQAWKDQGKPDSGVLRTRTASELATSEMGGDQSLSDFVTSIGRDGGSDILVPRDAVRAFVRNHFNQQTRAGQAAAAMRKPVKPEDFDAAVKYYNGEPVTAPMEVATPKPVEMKAPVQPKPVRTSTQPDIPTARPAQAADDVPATSARKAMVADDRAAMGLDELDDAVRKSFGESLDNARTKGYDGAWATREAEAVTAKPRALNDEETAGMVDAMARLKNDHKALLKQAENATDPAELSRINEGLKGIENQFDSISTAVRKSGTEKGRALASQKITLNEDFDLISVRSRARANKGGELTAKEDAELTKRVKELEDEITSQTSQIKDLTEKLVKAQEVRTATRATGFSKGSTSAVRKQAATRFQEAVAKSAGRTSMLALNDATPEAIRAFRQYVNAVVADGARGIDDVIKRMGDDGVQVDYEDIYKGLTEKTGLRKLSDIQKEIATARKELAAQARAAVEPDVPKAKRQMTREQKVKFREGSLRNQIAKIDAQIEQKKLFPKGAKIETPEIKRLEAIRKEKQAKLDEITKPQKEAQKVSGKAATIQSQIDELKKKAADGSLTAPERKAVDAELLQLRQQRDAARRLAQESSLDYNMGTIQSKLDAKAKAKATRESPEGVARQVKRTKEQLQADIAKLDQQIKSGEYIEAQPKVAREVDAEVYKLRMIRKAKEDRVRAIQESVRPMSGAETLGTVITEFKMLNPFARLTDVAANTSNLVSAIPETPFRFLADKAVGRVTKNDPLIRWNKDTSERLRRTMDRITGSTGAEFQRVFTGTDKASLEKFGKSRGPGGKLAGGTDVPFRVIYREFAHDLFAESKARKLMVGKSEAEISNMRETILRDLDQHPDVMDAAEEYSLYKTFNNDNVVSKSFSMVRNGVLKGDFQKVAFDELIARFSRVITNVAQDTFDRTPVGFVSQLMRLGVKRKELTEVQRLIISDKLAKGMVGSAASILGYLVGDQIKTEFKGDKSKYADSGDIEKLGGVAGAFLQGVYARNAETLKPDQEDDFKRRQVLNMLTNSPAASNVQDTLGALMQPGANKVEQFVAKKLSNVVIPGVVRDTAQRMDSPNFGLTGGATRREKLPQEENPDTGRMRQTRSFWLILMKEFQSKIPVARQALPLKDGG